MKYRKKLGRVMCVLFAATLLPGAAFASYDRSMDAISIGQYGNPGTTLTLDGESLLVSPGGISVESYFNGTSAVAAKNGASVDVVGGIVVNRRIGVEASGGSKVGVSGDIVVKAGSDKVGVSVTDGAATVIGNVLVSAGSGSAGIRAVNSVVNITGGVTLQSGGSSSTRFAGVNASGGSVVNVSGDVAHYYDGHAHIFYLDDSTLNLDGKMTIDSASGIDPRGIYATNGSVVNMSGDVAISRGGTWTSAISLYGKSTANYQGNVTISDSSKDYTRAFSVTDSALNVRGNIDMIFTEKSSANREAILLTNGSALDMAGNISITGGGNSRDDSDTAALRVQNSTAKMVGNIAITDSEQSIGIDTLNNPNIGVSTIVDFYGDIAISGGSGNVAAYAGSAGVSIPTVVSISDGRISLSGDSHVGLLAERGTFNLYDVTAEAGGFDLVRTTTSGRVYAERSGLNGNITHTGEGRTDVGGTLNVTLSDDSRLTGTVNAQAKGAAVALTLSDSDWYVTGNSDTRGRLLLDEESTVDYTKSALGTEVRVARLSGNGTFVMKADIPAEWADNLDISGSLSGSHKIAVVNQGSAAATGEERVKLVDAQDGTAGESTFALAHEVEYGGFRYALRASDDGRGAYDASGGQYWELYSTGSSNPGEGGTDTFIGNYYLAYAETDTLLKRLGELRSDRQSGKHGAWFRGFGGKMESGARSYAGVFDMDYWGVQVGYDYLLDRETSWFKHGDSYVGAFIGYSKSDMDFEQAAYSNGNLEHRTMGMYWSYLADKGHYFDAVAKYVQGRNDFLVYDSAGDRVHGGRVSTGGVGLSFEAGKRFRIGGKDGRFYAEPQLQLSWQHFGGATFHASNGLRIGVDDFDSLIGRAGFIFGYEGAKTSYYIKGFYLKEFQGDLKLHANDVRIYESIDDDWFVYGFGVTHRLSPRSALYLDLERSAGGDFEQEWNLNAGWRVSF